MIHLVLSLDYEIFGNGSGDVRRDMIAPTNRLLGLSEKYGAKLSIMFEVGEYWAMKEAEAAGSLRLGYSPSGEIEQQLQDAAGRGHDVQLHLHPWWIGARFENNRWQLRPEQRRLSDLPNNLGSHHDPRSIVEVLSRGKKTLEAIVRPVRPGYECLVYREAMFWGQPSELLVAGLKQAGLGADSSVVKGLYETYPVPTDYRRAEAATGYWWTRADEISLSGPEGEHIIEFPVWSQMRLYASNFKGTKLRVSLKRRAVERASANGHGMMQARKSRDSLRTILKKLGSSQPMKYDFCKLSARDMIRGLRQSLESDEGTDEGVGTPLVMLGHSKDFWNDRNLGRFLEFVSTQCAKRVCFGTLGDLTEAIVQRRNCEPTVRLDA